jgi:hypothetical protein
MEISKLKKKNKFKKIKIKVEKKKIKFYKDQINSIWNSKLIN